MARNILHFLDAITTLLTMVGLWAAYHHLVTIRKSCTAGGMSDHYVYIAVSISAGFAIFAGIIVLFNLGHSWIVGPTTIAVILTDMIYTHSLKPQR